MLRRPAKAARLTPGKFAFILRALQEVSFPCVHG